MLEAEARRVQGLEEEQVVLEMYHRYAVGLVMHLVAKVCLVAEPFQPLCGPSPSAAHILPSLSSLVCL